MPEVDDDGDRVLNSAGVPVMRVDEMDRLDPKNIKWPVNFEDLNWYLYKLPGKYRESLWLYWLTQDGTERIVLSGYGKQALPFPVDDDDDVVADPRIPVCSLPRERDYDGHEVEDYEQYDVRPPPLNVYKIVCNAEEEVTWKFGDLRKGEQSGVHFPFDASDAFRGSSAVNLLGPDLLVKQGVERAVDVHGPIGTRKLNRFDFSILESQPMGESPPEEDGYLAERFYGIPQDIGLRADYVANWRSAPIDPNRSHLMVFTFYEVRQEGDLKFNIGPDKGRWGNAVTTVSNWVRGEQGEMFRLPKRQIRRVICRAMIQPSGLNPSARESKAWYNHVIEGMSYLFADDVMPEFGGWLSKILSSISDLPGYLGIRTTELVCSGLGKLDDLTSLGNVSGPPLPAVVDEEGRIRVNAAVKSKLEGAKRCHRISSPPVSTCEGDADQILKGKCVRLPEFKLQVRTAEFIRPITEEKFDALVDLAEQYSQSVDPPEAHIYPLEYDEYRVEVPVGSYYLAVWRAGFRECRECGARWGSKGLKFDSMIQHYQAQCSNPVPDLTLLLILRRS